MLTTKVLEGTLVNAPNLEVRGQKTRFRVFGRQCVLTDRSTERPRTIQLII